MAIGNLTLRFLTELGGLASVGYAGLQVGGPTPVRILAAAFAAAALGVLWGLIVAPNARNGLTQSTRDLLGTALLLLAAGSVAIAGRPGLAIAFAMIVLVNTALMFAFGPGARETLMGGRS